MEDVEGQHDVSTRDGLVAFYDLAFAEVYWGAIQLTRSARTGDVTTVGLGWLVTTVRRLHIDRCRSVERETRRLRLIATSTSTVSSPEPPGSASMLDGLTSREQTALVLRYVEDLPVEEIAKLMDTTVRAIESLLQRAKRSPSVEEDLMNEQWVDDLRAEHIDICARPGFQNELRRTLNGEWEGRPT